MRFAARYVIAGLAILAVATGGTRAAIVINEIMYNSRELPDVEYVELVNAGPTAVNVAGWYLLDDTLSHPRCYLTGTIAAGAYRVVPGLTPAFTAKYPWVTNLNPNALDGSGTGDGFSLGNSSDEVRLYDALGTLVDRVNFTDAAPWPGTPDGDGPSLELTNPTLDNMLPTSWQGSTNVDHDGTPGVQNSVYQADQTPLVDDVTRNIALPTSSNTVVVTARVTDDHAIGPVALYVDEGSGFLSRPMWDDGLHGDGGTGDSIYGASIVSHATGTVVRYYILAMDNLPQTTLMPPGAPGEHYGYTVGHIPYQLVVNEILPKNETGIIDESGAPEDWLELRNREPFGIDIGGMYLSDRSDQPRKWRIPDGTVIAAGQRLLVWCDSDVNQGALHAGFKLNAGGGEVGLYETMDRGNVPVHALTYGISGADVSFGFFPEDTDAPEFLDAPTPGATNGTSSLHSSICINEFVTSSAAGGFDDWVELYNRGPAAVDITGWHLSDNLNVCDQPATNDYTFPPGTILPPGGFLVLDEVTLQFGWDMNGSDLIMLTHSDCATGQDYFDQGPQSPDVSQGRLPNGGSSWRFFAPASRNTPNQCLAGPAAFGPVSGLRFASRVEFVWNPVAAATAYDVVRGSLLTLRNSAGNFTAAAAACVEHASYDARSWDETAPTTNQGIFYLVRATSSSCATGTFDDGSVTQGGGRDGEIGQAAGACP